MPPVSARSLPNTQVAQLYDLGRSSVGALSFFETKLRISRLSLKICPHLQQQGRMQFCIPKPGPSDPKPSPPTCQGLFFQDIGRAVIVGAITRSVLTLARLGPCLLSLHPRLEPGVQSSRGIGTLPMANLGDVSLLERFQALSCNWDSGDGRGCSNSMEAAWPVALCEWPGSGSDGPIAIAAVAEAGGGEGGRGGVVVVGGQANFT